MDQPTNSGRASSFQPDTDHMMREQLRMMQLAQNMPRSTSFVPAASSSMMRPGVVVPGGQQQMMMMGGHQQMANRMMANQMMAQMSMMMQQQMTLSNLASRQRDSRANSSLAQVQMTMDPALDGMADVLFAAEQRAAAAEGRAAEAEVRLAAMVDEASLAGAKSA
eukprot:7375950-Prymnesium_polylepis.1